MLPAMYRLLTRCSRLHRIVWYIIDMRVRFTDSARKHGITEEAAVYAVEHAIYVEAEFTEPHPPSLIRPHLFIGPAGRYDQTLLEVFVELGREVKVFHVMTATAANLDRMKEGS